MFPRVAPAPLVEIPTAPPLAPKPSRPDDGPPLEVIVPASVMVRSVDVNPDAAPDRRGHGGVRAARPAAVGGDRRGRRERDRAARPRVERHRAAGRAVDGHRGVGRRAARGVDDRGAENGTAGAGLDRDRASPPAARPPCRNCPRRRSTWPTRWMSPRWVCSEMESPAVPPAPGGADAAGAGSVDRGRAEDLSEGCRHRADGDVASVPAVPGRGHAALQVSTPDTRMSPAGPEGDDDGRGDRERDVAARAALAGDRPAAGRRDHHGSRSGRSRSPSRPLRPGLRGSFPWTRRPSSRKTAGADEEQHQGVMADASGLVVPERDGAARAARGVAGARRRSADGRERRAREERARDRREGLRRAAMPPLAPPVPPLDA